MSVRYGLTVQETKALAAQLAAQRRRLGLNMREAAGAAGLSLATYSRAEKAWPRAERNTVERLRAWLAQGEKREAA